MDFFKYKDKYMYGMELVFPIFRVNMGVYFCVLMSYESHRYLGSAEHSGPNWSLA